AAREAFHGAFAPKNSAKTGVATNKIASRILTAGNAESGRLINPSAIRNKARAAIARKKVPNPPGKDASARAVSPDADSNCGEISSMLVDHASPRRDIRPEAKHLAINAKYLIRHLPGSVRPHRLRSAIAQSAH